MNDRNQSENQTQALKYYSMQEVSQTHSELLRRTDRDPANPFWNEVVAFVAQVCVAGATLESDEDRESAQKIVIYWSNALYRTGREPEQTLLAEFDASACPEIADDQCPYLTLGARGAGRESARDGWSRLIRECTRHLEQQNLVAIVGQSGSSRGFLIFEGILPRLATGVIPGSETWRILPQFTPQEEPLAELVRLIAPQSNFDSAVTPWSEQFKADTYLLKNLLDNSGDGPAVLIVNKFEHFFSIPREDASAFFSNLRKLVESSNHRVILKIRTDYQSQVTADETLGPLLERCQILVMLTANELRQTIEEPAKKIGLQFESGLIDRLVQDVLGDPNATQLLRFTLLQLWDYREKNRITWDSYRKLGGGRIAVERAADQLLKLQVQDRPKELLQWIWTRLIYLDVGREPDLATLRRSDFHREILSESSLRSVSSEAIDRTLSELVDANLLRCNKGATTDNDTFSIAQASLRRCWPQLREWIEEKRDEDRRWLRLRSAAAQWRSSGEGTELLWGGSSLKESEHDPKLTRPTFALEKHFIEASRRFENQKRFRRKVALASLAVLFVVLAGAGYKYQITQTKYARAEAKFAKAEMEFAEAETARAKAEKEALDAAKMDSDFQLSLASTRFGVQERDPSSQLVWYSKAYDLAESSKERFEDTQQQLISENYRSRLGFSFRAMPRLLHCLTASDRLTDPPSKLRLSNVTNDFRWALTVEALDTNQEVILWDLTKETPTARRLNPDAVVTTAKFSADGNSLVLGTKSDKKQNKSSMLKLWELPDDANGELSEPKNWEIPFVEQIDLIAINRDGKLILAVSTNKGLESDSSSSKANDVQVKRTESSSVGLVNCNDSKVEMLPEKIQGVVSSAEFSESGKRFLIASNVTRDSESKDPGSKVSIWDAANPPKLLAISSSTSLGSPLNFTCFVQTGDHFDDEEYFISCSGEPNDGFGRSILWKFSSDRNLIQEKWSWQHSGAVLHAASSPDRRYVATACDDRTVGILDLQNQSHTKLPHPAQVNSTAFSPNGLLLATACRDRKVRIWHTKTQKIFSVLECSGTPTQLSFSEDGLRLFAQAGDYKALVWDLSNEEVPPMTLGVSRVVNQSVLSSNCRSVVTIEESSEQNAKRRVQVWSIVGEDAPKCSWGFEIDSNKIPEVKVAVISPNQDFVAICGSESVGVVQGSAAEPTYIDNPDMNDRYALHACFSQDGTRFLVAGNNGSVDPRGIVKIWSLVDDQVKLISTIEGHAGLLVHACFSPDGKRILTCGSAPKPADPSDFAKGEAYVWDISEGDVVRQIQTLEYSKAQKKGHSENILFGTFSLDVAGRYVITTSEDNTACVWDTQNQNNPVPTATLSGSGSTTKDFHTADIVSAAFVPDQVDPADKHQIVTVGKDGRAILWDWKNNHTRVLDHEGESLKEVVFNNVGDRFLTISNSKRARVWDRRLAMSQTSMKVSPLIATLEHEGSIISAKAHPTEANRFLTLSQVGSATKYDMTGRNNLQPISGDIAPNHGVQVKELNIAPVETNDVPGVAAAALALAQRSVSPESQTLEEISLKELTSYIRNSTPMFHETRSDKISRQDRTRIWNSRQANAAEATGQWYAAAWHLNRLIEEGDTASDLRSRLANCYAQSGFYKEAINHWEAVCDQYGTEDSGKRLEAYAGLARAKARKAIEGLGEGEKIGENKSKREYAIEALSYFDQAIDQATDDVPKAVLMAERAVIKLQLNQFDPALADYSLAISVLEKEKTEVVRLASLFLERGKIYQKKSDTYAFADFIKAAELFSTSKYDGPSFTSALKCYDAALEVASQNELGSLQIDYGRFLIKAGEYGLEKPGPKIRSGIETLEESARLNSDWTLLRDLAFAYWELSDTDKSCEYFLKSLEQARKQSIDSDRLRSLHRQFTSNFSNVSNWDLLIEILTKEIEVFADDPQFRLTLLKQRASAHFTLRQLDRARTDLDASIAILAENTQRSENELRSLYTLRAVVFAKQELWSEADADLKRNLDLLVDTDLRERVWIFYRQSIVRLMAGNTMGYQECCRQLQREYEKATAETPSSLNASIRNTIAWTFALAPDSGLSTSNAARLSVEVVNESPNKETYHNTLRTAYYRDQKYSEVLESWKLTEEKTAEREGAGDPLVISADYFVLAMTHHSLKNHKESLEWLNKGDTGLARIQQEVSREEESLEFSPIWSQMEVRVLQREAQQLLGTPKTEIP